MTNTASQLVAIDIATALKCKPDEITKYLQVKQGDSITQGLVLAVKSSLFGLEKIAVQSPTDGLITGIDVQQGQLLVDVAPNKAQVKTSAPVEELPQLSKETNTQKISASKPIAPETNSSEVKLLEPENENLPVNIKQLKGVYGFGEGKGNGCLLEKDFTDKSLNAEMKGRVLIVDTVPTVKELYKASAMGIEAFVTNVSSSDIQEVFAKLQKEINGKTKIGFLVLPEQTNLDTLGGKYLQVLGEELLLNIEK